MFSMRQRARRVPSGAGAELRWLCGGVLCAASP